MKLLHIRFSKGITLVELLVVIAIVAAIAGITITIVNPVVQQNRARDGVLQKAVADIALALQSYYNIRGYFPDPSNAAQMNDFRNFLDNADYFDPDGSYVIRIVKDGITTGEEGNFIYWNIDPDGDTSIFNPNDPPCLQALSHQSDDMYVIWKPGQAVELVDDAYKCFPRN